MSVAPFPSHSGASAPEPPASEVCLALERILGSERFSRSERLRRFLELIVRQKLAGQADRLKEYKIATEVYDRGPGFNPATDTIVRVEARRLRTMLENYYGEEGASDAVRIDVPKGGYEPSFCRRPIASRRIPPTTLASTVAVLPFRDLSGGGEGEPFCSGLTAEIIFALTQVQGLRVAGPIQESLPNVVWNLSDDMEAGRTYASVVDGSVRRSAERVRITAQLVSALDGYNVWSQRFERELKDPFALQDEVAAAVVEAVCRLHSG